MPDEAVVLATPCDNRSTTVTDPRILRRFLADLDSPVLVSFPRTGSHWLRMTMELYFERPSLVRVFYYPDRTNYLTLHTHDLPGVLPEDIGADIERSNVIYLYRDPVDTVTGAIVTRTWLGGVA